MRKVSREELQPVKQTLGELLDDRKEDQRIDEMKAHQQRRSAKRRVK